MREQIVADRDVHGCGLAMEIIKENIIKAGTQHLKADRTISRNGGTSLKI